MKLVPLKGSPPMPTHRVCPRPTCGTSKFYNQKLQPKKFTRQLRVCSQLSCVVLIKNASIRNFLTLFYKFDNSNVVPVPAGIFHAGQEGAYRWYNIGRRLVQGRLLEGTVLTVGRYQQCFGSGSVFKSPTGSESVFEIRIQQVKLIYSNKSTLYANFSWFSPYMLPKANSLFNKYGRYGTSNKLPAFFVDKKFPKKVLWLPLNKCVVYMDPDCTTKNLDPDP